MLNKFYNKKLIASLIVIFAIIVLITLNLNKNDDKLVIENIEDTVKTEDENEDISKKIMIHITGCINSPGVIEIEEGARIIDVITAAGGITAEADITKVNLAYLVKDAQKIYIPSIYDENEIEYIGTENGDNVIVENKIEGVNAMININLATQTELESLSGIGPSTALKIISYREKNGKFKKIEDIKNVPGIGDSKFDSIKENIEV